MTANLDPQLRVELAFGEDPATDPSGWTWVDVGAVPDQTISIRRGRQDEGGEVAPSQVSIELYNQDGALTPTDRRSPHWPHVRRGTPVRASARLQDADAWNVRFVGQVSEWQPSWPLGDLSDHDNPEEHPGEARMTIVCNGILRRLGQGARPLESPLARELSSDPDVVGYWPLETGARTDRSGSPLAGLGPIATTGAVEWQDDTTATPAGSRPLPKLAAGRGSWLGVIPVHSAPAGWTFHQLVRIPSFPAGGVEVCRVATSGGNTVQWRVEVDGDSFEIAYLDASNPGEPGWATTGEIPYDADLTTGWVRVSLYVRQNGSDIDVSLLVVPSGLADADAVIDHDLTVTGKTAGRASSVGARVAAAPSGGMGFGHVTLALGAHAWNASAERGWQEELAADRVARLCTEEQLDLVIVGDAADSTRMGPQTTITLVELLTAAAAAEVGILGEQVDRPGLTFLTRAARYNQAVDLTLDASADEIAEPFDPAFDDQRLRNDITVTREGGASAQAVDQESINAEERYDDQVTLVLATDDQARHHAAWRLRAGTWDTMRYPAIGGALDTAPAADWLNLGLGDRIQVTDLPPQHPAEVVDVVVEGLTETITPVTWKVEANCSPAGFWDVGILDDDPDDPDISLARIDSGGSTLAASIDDDDTTISVAVTGILWTTNPDNFPLVIEIDGEPMTVTSITGASSPQTFIVARDTEAPTAHSSGAEVHVAPGLVLAL